MITEMKTLTIPTLAAEERRRLAKRSLPVRSFVRPAIVLYDEDSPAAEAIGEISAVS